MFLPQYYTFSNRKFNMGIKPIYKVALYLAKNIFKNVPLRPQKNNIILVDLFLRNQIILSIIKIYISTNFYDT